MRCCRTKFPLCYNFSAERGVRSENWSVNLNKFKESLNIEREIAYAIKCNSKNGSH